MYISTVEGRVINLAHVSSIARLKARGSHNEEHYYYCEFALTNGNAVVVGHVLKRQIEEDFLNELCATIMPAVAGYFTLLYVIDPDVGETVIKEPIVGWKSIRGAECPVPITILGSPQSDACSMLHPDGRVSDPVYPISENYQQWLAGMRAKHLQAKDWRTVYAPDDI